MRRTSVILFVAVVFVLLLPACAGVAPIGDITGKNAMNIIFDKTFETVKGAWVMSGWVLGIGLGLAAATIVYTKMDSGRGAAGTFVVVGLIFVIGFSVMGGVWAKATATHAVVVGADKAKTRKANQYKEKLHIPVTKAVLETRDCHQQNNGGTGCRYEWTYTWNYHEVCTTVYEHDKDGNVTGSHPDCHTEWDTMHVPYFTQEWRTYAYFAMPDKYLLNKVGEDSGTGLTKSEIPNMPYRIYTDWQAPVNYEAYWFGNDQRFGNTPDPIGGFGFAIPQEWLVMDAALKTGRPYVITVWHDYVNWVFVTQDTNNLMTTSSQVDKYLAAGLLPQVNMIYSRYGTPGQAQDYDFIQFAGGLQPVDYLGWQDFAAMASLKVGPELQGSMVIWFVPAGAVDNPDAWIQAAKAYLSNREKWGFYMAPKNLVLIGCGVDTATNVISFCRMETGMPSGNVEIRYTIDHISGVPFTPQGVFGTLAPVAVPDANGFYASTMELPQDGFLNLLFAPDGQGFVRVRMQSLDWLKTDMKLDAPDIEWAVTTESAQARTVSTWLNIIGILVAVLIVGATIYSENEN
ncbi:hypothetical protein A3A84_03830 [Candidatus Collierbacteria bacterium RIFCSPLOWO2_01_FULL_50_23]|uniref:Uncharacterized protein n=1 Tax=Candidatus Collierbacteria bacterium RIFCSPHIGHO2_01_FULL_50_25 TaxID=1817722 RepID=A0A1F5EV85_9BACT|nr:MAG: hypothetical protein A2703_03410 [Candidatus Collierbacteria bacterium RIFCSPHIGHO2_01_FULL_50_25]OGD75300.1 MAG: hypothetical protein A3A84_03830 [Candidatus Collierbacteria bacterium RIFCSPLOWO2_01_FULL_50_23]